VFANELVGYLSATQRRFDVRGIDEPVRLTLAEADYQPEVRIRAPRVAEGDVKATVPAAKDGQYVVEAPGAPRSGILPVRLEDPRR
jgi:hypothetical protein